MRPGFGTTPAQRCTNAATPMLAGLIDMLLCSAAAVLLSPICSRACACACPHRNVRKCWDKITPHSHRATGALGAIGQGIDHDYDYRCMPVRTATAQA